MYAPQKGEGDIKNKWCGNINFYYCLHRKWVDEWILSCGFLCTVSGMMNETWVIYVFPPPLGEGSPLIISCLSRTALSEVIPLVNVCQEQHNNCCTIALLHCSSINNNKRPFPYPAAQVVEIERLRPNK